jgi:hypothetical protein
MNPLFGAHWEDSDDIEDDLARALAGVAICELSDRIRWLTRTWREIEEVQIVDAAFALLLGTTAWTVAGGGNGWKRSAAANPLLRSI